MSAPTLRQPQSQPQSRQLSQPPTHQSLPPSPAHAVRVTARFHLGTFRKEADLSLPTSSSLAEVIDDITALVGAPTITRPWRITTSGGRVLSQDTPLYSTPVADGMILVFAPHEDAPAPVIRDSAEALVATATDAEARGIATTWSLTGLSAGIVMLSAFVPMWAALLTGAVVGLTVALWTRRLLAQGTLPAFSTWLVAVSGAAGWCAIAGWNSFAEFDRHLSDHGAQSFLGGAEALVHACLVALLPPTVAQLSLALFAAAACAVAAVVLCAATGLCGARLTSATLTAALIGVSGAAAAHLPGASQAPAPLPAAGGMAIAVGLVVLLAAPSFSSRLAGLSVPRLPTAGQDLGISDEKLDDVESRAQLAHNLYEGAVMGLSVALLPCMGAIALTGSGLSALDGGLFGSVTGGGFAQALGLTVTGAVVLHAARHGAPSARWALMAVAGAGVCAAAVTAWLGWAGIGQRPQTWAILPAPAAALLAAVRSPLWVRRMPRLEPTTVIWFERAEALAVAASLPLALHIAGLFALIRGLG